ncbi:MAG: lytic transglycosylase domain-containing protein [Boseongicola sp.]|nr:lytic transglycosylase domain-containing protein [Boseongicola sp.]
MIKALFTAVFLIWIGFDAQAQTTREGEALGRAFDAMESGDWYAALRTAEGINPVARDIIEWHRLRARQGDFDSVIRFLDRRPDWPGLAYLRQRSESTLPLSARADDVIAFFGGEHPQTGTGAVALISAFRAKGMEADAEAEALHAWLTHRFSAADQTKLLTWYGRALAPHHADRLDMLLWRGAERDARTMIPLVPRGWAELAEARIALRADKNGVDALVAAVPENLADHPGLLFERMQWRARKGRNDGAIELLLAQSPDELGQPARWAGWRRSLVRSEMRAGRTTHAYELASQHGLTSGSSFADLEWLSGYLALTYQNDPAKALNHFLRFRGAVDTPISLGRAGYWEGRAHEALGDTDTARLAYSFGAEYQTSFYGLLAAEKAGRPMDPALYAPVPSPDLSNAGFAESSVFAAALLLDKADQKVLAERFLTHLTETLPTDDIIRLGAFVTARDEPHYATMIGKRAASYGTTVPFIYYPVTDLGVDPMPVPTELALAIARRESEFDPVVTSGVGARGLMQVMPATAREVAGFLEIPYDGDRLLNDPAYNARIGTAYLDELMTMFDGNPVMVAAAYNAGPSRPLRWMRERGDPRRGQMDVIDWIEHIPFNETRNYVMRVAESLPVYRARLTGQPQRMNLSEELISMRSHTRSATKGLQIRPKARPAILTD